MANSFFNVLQGYTKGIRFVAVLIVLLTMGIGQAWGETWEKVTSAPSDWSGDYLIVYEDGKVAFDGSRTTLDAASNTFSVTISDGKITTASTTGDTKYFTIAKSGSNYTIKSASGKYIGNNSNSNALTSSTTILNNTISLNNGEINIVSSGGAYLRYNATSSISNGSQTGLRFRYYKSSSYTGQKAIQLYKKKSAAYTLHYGIDGQSNWKSEEFEEVGNNNEMQISNFTIPSTTHFYVGKPDFNGTKGTTDGPNSNTDTWSTMYLANSLDVNYADASPKIGQATGAVGTIRIYSNSTWNNKQAAFIPNGYKLKFGTTEYAFTHQSNGEYHSDIVEYNTTSARYNVSAGVINGSNGYVATNNTQEMQHIFLNTGGTNFWGADNVTNFGLYDITNGQFTCLMVKVPGEQNLYEGWVPSYCTKVIFVRLKSSTVDWNNKHNQTIDVTLESGKNIYTINNWNSTNGNSAGTWSAYTRKGKFRMNDNYKDKNWYVRFYPHYVVTYNANGGDGTMAEQTVPADNASIKISTNTFTRTGYTFNGWKTQTNGGSSYTAGTSYTITSDLTLYAQWKANTYTITLNGNNGSGHTASVTATYNSATLSPSTITNPTRAGYTFGGWYSASGGAGSMVIGIDGELQANVSGYTGANGIWIATADKTLYAKWTPNTYRITLSAPNSSISLQDVQATYNSSSITGTITNPTKTDYIFSGWYSAENGTGNLVIDTEGKLQASVSGYTGTGGVWIANEDKILYAQWTKIHTITWKVNGQQYGATQEVVDGQTIGTLPKEPDAPTSCSDKVFMGWTESATVNNNGTGITYISTDTQPDGDKIYHAVFATKEDGGSGDYELVTSAPDDWSGTYLIVDGTSKNCFNGSLTNLDAATNYKSVTISNNNITSNNTTDSYSVAISKSTTSGKYYIKTASGYYIGSDATSSSDGNELDASTTTKYDNSISISSNNVTIEGPDHILKFFYQTGQNWRFRFYKSTTTQNVRLPQLYRKSAGTTYTDYVTSCIPQYTITLNPNGGATDDAGDWTKNGDKYTLAVQEGKTITPPTFTKKGYNFDGWYTDENCTLSFNTATPIQQAYNLYAKWDCALTEIRIEGTFAITQGGTIALNVVDNANIAPNATYQWKHGDKIVGTNSPTLNVECLLANAGNYTCTVTNAPDCHATNNFTVKYYHLKGFVEDDAHQNPDSWDEPYEFIWDGNGNNATLTIELKGHTTYQFKLNDVTAWYWNEGTITYNNHTDWVIEQQGDDTNDKKNTKITTTAPGIYTFKLNYDDAAKPKLSVIYPSEQTIYLKPGVWNTDGAKFTIYSWSSSDYSPATFTPMELADCDGNVYKANINPAHDWVSFIRASQHVADWNTDMWNRSLDLKIMNTPQFNILEWGGTDQVFGNDVAKSRGEWSAYTPYYNISYNMNGHGDLIGPACVMNGNSWIAPSNPTATGYTFLGWKRPLDTGDNTLYKDDDSGYVPTKDEELIAQWQINVHKLTWNPNGGTLAGDYTSGNVEYGTTIISPADPNRIGYKFLGWHDGHAIVTPALTMPDHSLTYTAHWKPIPTLQWSAEECTVTIASPNNSLPTLTVTPEAVKSGVKFESSIPTVATIDATGRIVLKSAGTTIIRAYYEEDATYAEAEDSYELIVEESTNCKWVETEIKDIEYGDEVVVTMGTNTTIYALHNTEKITNSPKATKFSVIGNCLEDFDYSSYSWYITKTNDGYQLQSCADNSKYLYGVSSYISIGSNPTTFFIYKSPENGHECFSYVYSSKAYYIGCGYENSQLAWKRFESATTPLTTNTLKFYKKVCLDSENYWVTWDANGGAWSDGSTKKEEIYTVGTTITKPTEPIRDGYQFAGWYKESECTNAWNFDTETVTENTTLYAKWLEKFTITWMVNAEEYATTTVIEGYPITPPDDPKSDDHCGDVFAGWTDTEIDGEQTAEPKLYPSANAFPNASSNTTFYAVFADYEE